MNLGEWRNFQFQFHRPVTPANHRAHHPHRFLRQRKEIPPSMYHHRRKKRGKSPPNTYRVVPQEESLLPSISHPMRCHSRKITRRQAKWPTTSRCGNCIAWTKGHISRRMISYISSRRGPTFNIFDFRYYGFSSSAYSE